MNPKPRRLCKQGHPIRGNNVTWKSSRGRNYRTCRACFNAYHLIKNREQRARR